LSLFDFTPMRDTDQYSSRADVDVDPSRLPLSDQARADHG
jgi:hypothetical protein